MTLFLYCGIECYGQVQLLTLREKGPSERLLLKAFMNINIFQIFLPIQQDAQKLRLILFRDNFYEIKSSNQHL